MPKNCVHTRTSLQPLVFFQIISFPSYSPMSVPVPGKCWQRDYDTQYPDFSHVCGSVDTHMDPR